MKFKVAQLALYRGRVERALRSKRGQAFLREMIAAFDALPEKRIIASQLIGNGGECCSIGAVCKARGTDVTLVDCENPKAVAFAVGVAESMAAEIEFMNDEWCGRHESPADRWARMRAWAVDQLREP